MIINKYLREQFTLDIIYAAPEILQPSFCLCLYIVLEVKVNKYFQRKQRRVKKYWHLFFMFQYMKNMLWNTLPKYIILLQPIVLKETFVPFLNNADKPAFMLLSLRRGRDWKTWLTEIEEEGCIGQDCGGIDLSKFVLHLFLGLVWDRLHISKL